MKPTVLLLLLCCRFLSGAEPGAPAAAGNQDVEIVSDSFEYHSEKSVAIYRGNVRVKDPQMEMTCVTLTIQFVATNDTAILTDQTNRSQKVETIVAEGGVVMTNRQEKLHAVGERLIYHALNDTVELFGNPVIIQSPRGTITADKVIWDRKNFKWWGTNQKTTLFIKSDGTNSSSFFGPPKPRPK